jgi:hypothetical protein
MGTRYGNPTEEKRTVEVYKVVIPDPTDDQEKFIVDGKKDEVVGVIMTYISWEIHFTSVESTFLIKSGRR